MTTPNDVYPRSTTWPYVMVVAAALIAVAAYPRWSSESKTGWSQRGSRAFRSADSQNSNARGEHSMGRVQIDFRPDWMMKADLRPAVQQRLVIEADVTNLGLDEVHNDTVAPSGLELSMPRVETNRVEATQSIRPGPDRSLDEPYLSDDRFSSPSELDPLQSHDELDSQPSNPPSLDIEISPSAARVAGVWPVPKALLLQLDALPTSSSTIVEWRDAVRDQLERLVDQPAVSSEATRQNLYELLQLARVIPHLEAELSPIDQPLLRRIGHGLDRRLSIWSHLHSLAGNTHTLTTHDVTQLLPTLNRLRNYLQTVPQGEAWQHYLMIDRLEAAAQSHWSVDPVVRRELARAVLERLAPSELTDEQQAVAQSDSVLTLQQRLREWATEPIDHVDLASTIEQYEALRTVELAAVLTGYMNRMQWSTVKDQQSLYRLLDTHYRNANIRFMVTEKFMNDFLPALEPIREQLREKILGADVAGQNATWTQLKIQLMEDESRIRLRFIAAGDSRSRTVSTRGPVRFYTRGQSRFSADKELIFAPHGLYVTPAAATASNQTELIDVQTDYDQIPLVGWLVRRYAMDEHQNQRGQVWSIVQQRVKRTATRRLDDQLGETLTDAEAKVHEHVLTPLNTLELDPRAIEMRTAADHVVLRARVAAPAQLAAYTPRPRSVPGCAMSFQIHESMVNNLLQQLKLDGKQIELEELLAQINQQLPLQRSDLHEEIPEDVYIRLGNDRPVQVDFQNNEILVTIRIAELRTPRRRWRNFTVRGRYDTRFDGQHIELHREDGIELDSEEIGFRDQVALRGIFTKVMARDHRLQVLRGRFQADPDLKDLRVTQLVVTDGWVAVSVGRQGPPEQHDEVASREESTSAK